MKSSGGNRGRLVRWGVPGVLFLLVLLSFWVRAQYIQIHGGTEPYIEWANQNYFGGVTGGYWRMADDLRQGGSYIDPGYPPGYAFFIAGARRLVGDDPQRVRAVQALLDSLTVVGVFLLLRGLAIPIALALLGCAAYACNPAWAAGSTFLLAEWLGPATLVWGLVLLLAGVGRGAWWRFALLGGLSALAGLTRPDLLFLPLFLGLPLLWALGEGKRGVALAALGICFAIPIAAWGTHNKLQHGHWIFTSTSGGNTLWEGLGELPNDHGYTLDDAFAIKLLAERGMSWHSPEADRFFKQEYLRAWREHPGFVMQVILHRWNQILFKIEKWPPYLFHWIVRRMPKIGLLLVLGALALRRRDSLAIVAVALPIVYALLSVGLVHYEPRYVRYTQLSYLVASGLLLAAAWRRLEPRFPSPARWGALVLVAIAGVLSGVELVRLGGARAEVEVRATLRDLAERDEPGTRLGLHELDWRKATRETEISSLDDGLRIDTGEAPFAYQITAPLAVAGLRGIVVEYTIEVEEGGALVGILSGAGRWATQEGVSGRGRHQGRLVAATGGDDRPLTLVIANNVPAGGSSRFVIVGLDVLAAPE